MKLQKLLTLSFLMLLSSGWASAQSNISVSLLTGTTKIDLSWTPLKAEKLSPFLGIGCHYKFNPKKHPKLASTFGIIFLEQIDYINVLRKYPGAPGTYSCIDNSSLIETPCIVGPDTVCEGDQVKRYSTFSAKFEMPLTAQDFSKVFSTDSVVITLC